MPILYVHGVAIREDASEKVRLGPPVAEWAEIEALLRQYVAPELAPDPKNVPLERLYWGDLGAKLAWKGRSRPVPPSHPNLLEQIEHLSQELPLIAKLRGSVEGFLDVFVGDFLSYFVNRGTPQQPGPIIVRALEVLKTLYERGQGRDHEPFVIISHSMGGQIVYDLLSAFIPQTPELSHIKVDFWVNAGSQIGLLEEMKVFLASSDSYSLESGLKVPKPPSVGYWWDVWDYGDPLSYTVAEIFDRVDTEPFRAGIPLLFDHVAYMGNPAFYSFLATKLQHARALHWFRHVEPNEVEPNEVELEQTVSQTLSSETAPLE